MTNRILWSPKTLSLYLASNYCASAFNYAIADDLVEIWRSSAVQLLRGPLLMCLSF